MQSFIQIKLTRYLFDLTITQQTPKNRLKTYALSRLKQQYNIIRSSPIPTENTFELGIRISNFKMLSISKNIR